MPWFFLPAVLIIFSLLFYSSLRFTRPCWRHARTTSQSGKTQTANPTSLRLQASPDFRRWALRMFLIVLLFCFLRRSSCNVTYSFCLVSWRFFSILLWRFFLSSKAITRKCTNLFIHPRWYSEEVEKAQKCKWHFHVRMRPHPSSIFPALFFTFVPNTQSYWTMVSAGDGFPDIFLVSPSIMECVLSTWITECG